MKRFAEFFSDGQFLSAFRLMYIAWGLGVLGVWIFLNIYSCLVLHTVTMVGLNPMVLSWLISLAGGKIVQNITENQRDKLEINNNVSVATPEVPKV